DQASRIRAEAAQVRAEAAAEGERLLADAERMAHEVVAEAESHAQQRLAEAEREAEQIRRAARDMVRLEAKQRIATEAGVEEASRTTPASETADVDNAWPSGQGLATALQRVEALVDAAKSELAAVTANISGVDPMV